MQLLSAMSTRGRITLAASVLGIVVVAFLLFRIAAQPSYSTMMTGIDPSQTGKVTEALDERGIGYELQNNGTALAVEKAQMPEARVALATAGVSGQGKQPGYELLDKQKLGSSDFQQKINYQRALEGEIAGTIDKIPGVGGAQVQLSLPEDELFTDEAKPPTAAVLLGSSGDTVDPGQVRGIANLVASSVEGLKQDKVTITDGTGRLMWPQGDKGGGSGATAQATAETRYGSQIESSLNAMLARTLGPGKAQVKVNADLNVDEATRERLQYDRQGTALREREEIEQLEGGQGAAGGAGADANLAGGGAAGAQGASNYEKNATETDFGVGKTVTRTRIAPGEVERLDVALMLDQSVPREAVAGLRQTVSSAAGIQTDRGDTLSVAQLAFAKLPAAEEPKASPIPPFVLGPAKWVGLGLGALLFLFFVTRALRKREDSPLGPEPTWLREIDAPRPLAELQAAAGGMQLGAPTVAEGTLAHSRHVVENLVQQEPEKVAAQVRNWIAEEDA